VHLADGILDPAVLVGGNALGLAVGAATLRRGRSPARSAAWTGTLAAFVLAAQALNVPLVPGASAHVIGAGLLTLTLGARSAALALSAVVVVQALLFADGGVTALGINALHVALLPVLVTSYVARALGPRRLELAAVLGTALGSAAAASSLALMLTLGAGVAPKVAFGWLVGLQTLAGLIEGGLTALAVRQLRARAPGLLQPSGERPEASRAQRQALAWAALALALVVVLLPLASRAPDALERAVSQARR
jgi:cobalt/nickel transport system permease protein